MIVYLNGSLVPADEARVSVFDRGFLLGDGLYEGLRADGGHTIALGAHIDRLRSGMEELRMPRSGPSGFDPASLGLLTDRLLDANGLTDAFIYWQVTRGVPGPGEPRRDRLPPDDCTPTVMGYAVPVPAVSSYQRPTPVDAALRPDTRWLRGHVKAITLLGGVLASIEADELGAEHAVLHRDDVISEGVSTNVFVAKDGVIATPSETSSSFLPGVTRALILGEMPEIEVRPVTVEETRDADEIVLVGTKSMVLEVTQLDGERLSGAAHTGARASAAQRLLDALRSAIERDRIGSRTGPRLRAGPAHDGASGYLNPAMNIKPTEAET